MRQIGLAVKVNDSEYLQQEKGRSGRTLVEDKYSKKMYKHIAQFLNLMEFLSIELTISLISLGKNTLLYYGEYIFYSTHSSSKRNLWGD